jgi:GxxExxY protein
MDHDDRATQAVIGAAMEVHSRLGPGLLEAVYQHCLCLELHERNIPFRAQAAMPVIYKGVTVPLGYRADILVAEAIIVDVKAVSALTAAHKAQVLTYLRLSGARVGLLMNFHARRLKDGLRRLMLG